MATEEQKRMRQLRLLTNVCAGYAKGLYDLFGDSTLATASAVGSNILKEMEDDLGLEIQGEDPQDILTEVERLLVDEYEVIKHMHTEFSPETGEGSLMCEGCLLAEATRSLTEAGIPPLTCVPTMVVAAALRERLHRKVKFVNSGYNPDTQACNITFRSIG